MPPTSMETHLFSFEDDSDDSTVVPMGTARFTAMQLMLVEPDTHMEFSLALEPDDRVIVGRFDPETKSMPDINLEECRGEEKGVSRRHMLITRRDNSLLISDMETRNGTYLNGQQLIANQLRILRDGDQIRLGRLLLDATFVRRARANA
jgi:hypothetical protein